MYSSPDVQPNINISNSAIVPPWADCSTVPQSTTLSRIALDVAVVWASLLQEE